MEVICERCIQPHTEYRFLEEYSWKDIYFDVEESNPYFYCIAEADKQNYVRWYDVWVSCQDGSSQSWSRPFCPANRINLEEAVAVLLRNSWIFTIADNQRVVNDIVNGSITQTLWWDVVPTDAQGNPYTFYGYIRKALDYEIQDYDASWNFSTLKLIDIQSWENINPQSPVTKQEFLKMAYIALKSNSCSTIEWSEIALNIIVYDKVCDESNQEECDVSDLTDPEDTYDFTSTTQTSCELWINTQSGYSWRFLHVDSWQQIFRYWEYQDNFILNLAWTWRIYLRAEDNCWNSSEVYSTIEVPSQEEPDDDYIDVDIDVFDDSCIAPWEDCEEIEFEEDEDDNDDIFDFDGDVSTSCEIWSISYDWTFTHINTGNVQRFTTEYIDNYEFLEFWEWFIQLTARDWCGQEWTEQLTYIVTAPPIIIVLPPICEQDEPCSEDPIDPTTICEDGADECLEIILPPICQIGDSCDYTVVPPATSCTIWWLSYNWTFTNTSSGDIVTRVWGYIDNFSFLSEWRWEVLMVASDWCENEFIDRVYVLVGDTPNDLPVLDIDVDIDVFDDNCTAPWLTCTEIEFEDEEDDGDDVFDFDGDVSTNCSVSGITYSWRFTHRESNTFFTFESEFVDNFFFSRPWVWDIILTAQDACGQSGTEQMIYIVRESGTSLSVWINANPIFWPESLVVDFSPIISWWVAPYSYEWNLWDTTVTYGANITHLYRSAWSYRVILEVLDSQGNSWAASTVILVTENRDICLVDSDGDLVFDCDDDCPIVPWESGNSWCPNLESSCGEDCACDNWYTCSISDPLTCSTGVCVPDISIPRSCLYNPNEGSIFWSAVCLSCPCNSYADFLADMRRCDLIFPAITSPNGSQIYSQWDVWQVR